MGYKDPNKVRPSEWREFAPTVEKMRRYRWEVRATCRSCRAWWVLDLEAVEAKLGPEFSLWGRSPRCKMVTTRCQGRCKLMALPPHRSEAFELA